MNEGNTFDYQLLEQLGKGSYGTVFKIKHFNKIRVLKQIDINHLTFKKQQQALKEVQILKQLNHPNVIKYHTSFIEKGVINIIMEYAEKGDLVNQIQRLPKNQFFEEQKVWSIAYQLTEALAHLHNFNIIHRDVKPLNVFLTKDIQVKLGDLGVSKIMNQQNPAEGTQVGTPLYLAPEQVLLRPYDSKVDVWALGCVLYFICMRFPPFSGENLIQLGYSIVNKQPRPISAFYSSKLAKFIGHLLTKDPKVRPLIKEVQEFFKKEDFKQLQQQQNQLQKSYDEQQLLLLTFSLSKSQQKSKEQLTSKDHQTNSSSQFKQNEDQDERTRRHQLAIHKKDQISPTKNYSPKPKVEYDELSMHFYMQASQTEIVNSYSTTKEKISNFAIPIKRRQALSKQKPSTEDEIKQSPQIKKIPTQNYLLDKKHSYDRGTSLPRQRPHYSPLVNQRLDSREPYSSNVKVVSASLHNNGVNQSEINSQIKAFVQINYASDSVESDVQPKSNFIARKIIRKIQGSPCPEKKFLIV